MLGSVMSREARLRQAESRRFRASGLGSFYILDERGLRD